MTCDTAACRAYGSVAFGTRCQCGLVVNTVVRSKQVGSRGGRGMPTPPASGWQSRGAHFKLLGRPMYAPETSVANGGTWPSSFVLRFV